MVLIANVFAKLCTGKNVPRERSKKCRFTEPFNKQYGKGAKTLLKSERRPLYHIYWSLQRQLGLKKSLLVIWKILRLFVNTFNADGKYSVLNRDNLTEPIQMQLWKKQKTFSALFSSFFKPRLNFQDCPKKDDPHSWCFGEKMHYKKRG